MLSQQLITPVDKLVEIVKENNNCTIDFIKQKLNLPIELIEKWLVVLEEYKILKVHYKGFEGYVDYLEKENKNEINVDNLKDKFLESAKSRNYTYEQMRQLWPKFIEVYEKEIKELFEKKAKKLGFEQNKIEIAWQKYRKDLGEL